ncbi:MAG: hypothetical protein JJLCMIEE_00837 [Acidimicrobiales bacterium]|nr:hypothetical protein [Acidimicrobiales bacterium]
MPDSTGTSSDDIATVVIPARNEERFIGGCLESVLSQTYQRLQVLVVDGASSDRTVAIAERYADTDPRVEIIHNPDRTVPTGLNRALAAAKGRYFVRIDAHSTVPPEYVATAVGLLRSGKWGGVGGRKDGVGVTPTGTAVACVMSTRFGVGDSLYHYGEIPQPAEHVPFGAYETLLVRELGGWNESLPVNQDYEFDHRVRKSGRELLFDPHLTVEWHCRQTLRELFRQYRRYGQGKSMVARLHPDSLRARHLAAPALVAVIGAALVTAPRRPRLAAAMVFPYAVALGVSSCLAGRRVDGVRAKLAVPVAYLCMHVGWGVGFWEGVTAQLLGSTPRPTPTSAVGSV